MAGLDFLGDELAAIEAAGLRRTLRTASGLPGAVIEIDGRRVLNFSSNDYLGLAGDGRLAASAAAALCQGTGATASRLIAGNRAGHQDLEQALARFHGVEAARLFNSGFQTNVGLLDALAGAGDLILSDELNHASLIDGCRLSRARVHVFSHGDVGAVAALLREHRAGARRCFVVTEGVFSMDGDRAPLAELRDLTLEHDAALVVDDAHAVGVDGDGRGSCAEVGVTPDVLVGTFGKSFGSFGAYVAGSSKLCEFLLQRGRSFIFSTALPPAVVAASTAALRVIDSDEGRSRRATLRANIGRLRAGLAERGRLVAGAGGSPIFPILIGDDRRAMECTRLLLERGLFVQGIRPPTVPAGTARLRIALMAGHEPAHIDRLLEAFDDLSLLP